MSEEFQDDKLSKAQRSIRNQCILCKAVGDGAQRMFMFGGCRPFMAEFENKLTNFIGKDKFLALCKEFRTESGRSYICKLCFKLVNGTYDCIKKVQSGISRTVEKLKCVSLGGDFDCNAGAPKRTKLPPLCIRIAQKIAHITCVRINNKIPCILLKRVKTSRSTPKSIEMEFNQPSNFKIQDFEEENISSSNGELKQRVIHLSNVRNSGRESTENKGEATTPTTRTGPSISSEVSANPSLLVKSAQALQLKEIKNNSVYICGEDGCDWIFSSKFLWDNHRRHYHFNGKLYACTHGDCGQRFSSKSRLSQHLRTHTGERPFVCELCGRAFMGSHELTNHRRTHTEGKPFKCPRIGCEQSYKYRATLMRHLQHHDGYSPYPCDFPGCNRVFKNRYELKCHYRRHTGERPIVCSEPGCKKTFRLPCELTKHRRVEHTGERPFKCPVEGCRTACATRGEMTNHSLTHNTENSFCCELCGRTFKYKMSYVLHHRTHTARGQYTCDVEDCRQTFHFHNLLEKHKRHAHGTHRTTQCRVRRSNKLGMDVHGLNGASSDVGSGVIVQSAPSYFADKKLKKGETMCSFGDGVETRNSTNGTCEETKQLHQNWELSKQGKDLRNQTLNSTAQPNLQTLQNVPINELVTTTLHPASVNSNMSEQSLPFPAMVQEPRQSDLHSPPHSHSAHQSSLHSTSHSHSTHQSEFHSTPHSHSTRQRELHSTPHSHFLNNSASNIHQHHSALTHASESLQTVLNQGSQLSFYLTSARQVLHNTSSLTESVQSQSSTPPNLPIGNSPTHAESAHCIPSPALSSSSAQPLTQFKDGTAETTSNFAVRLPLQQGHIPGDHHPSLPGLSIGVQQSAQASEQMPTPHLTQLSPGYLTNDTVLSPGVPPPPP